MKLSSSVIHVMQTLSRIESFRRIVIFLFLLFLLLLQKVRRNSNIRRSVQLSVFREDPSNRKSIRAPVNFRNACASISPRHRSLVQQSCELTRCICRNTPIDGLDKKRRKRFGIISNWFVRLAVPEPPLLESRV